MEEALISGHAHSVEAEQSVVGAMLMDKDAITTASEIISGQDFIRHLTEWYLIHGGTF